MSYLAAIPAYVWIATSVAGTAVSAAAMIQQGRAQAAQAKFDAKVADQNAKIAAQNAQLELDAANSEAERLRRLRNRTIGSQAAAAARSGLTLSGSVVGVMSDTVLESERDVANTLYAGRTGALNQLMAARDFSNNARLSRAVGRNARSASAISAGGTLLSGVGNAGITYAQLG